MFVSDSLNLHDGLFTIKRIVILNPREAGVRENPSWLECYTALLDDRWSRPWKCVNKNTKVSSHPKLWFSAISHCLRIGIIFPYSGYFNLVQHLCRLLPLETNHKADRSPAEWIWFPCWKGLCGQMWFSQVAITAATAPFRSGPSLLVLQHLQRPSACTQVQWTDVWHPIWQTRLYERSELKAFAGLRAKHVETTGQTMAQWEISRPTVK